MKRVVEPVGIEVSPGAAELDQPANSIPVGRHDLWLKQRQARPPSDLSLPALRPYAVKVKEDSNPAGRALGASWFSGQWIGRRDDNPFDPERLLQHLFGKTIDLIRGEETEFDLNATCAKREEQKQKKGGGEPGSVIKGGQHGKPGRERGADKPDNRREDRKLRRPNPRKKDDNEGQDRAAHVLFHKQPSCQAQADDEPELRLEEGDEPWRRLHLTHPSDSRAGEDHHLSPLDEPAVRVEQSNRRRR